ncbi:phospholipase-like protein [Tanacetum coccineum]
MLFDHEPLLIDYMLRRQHKVDDQHHDMPLIYYMEGHSLHFGRREFSLITGFRFETVNFDLHPFSDLKFRNRVFPNKIGYIITNLDIIGVIEDEERFGKLSDDDAIRLCLLLAVEVIFMGRLLTFKVDDTLFRLVENIEAWNSFPWGEHLWCHLYDEIKNLKQRHSDEHYYGLKKDRNYVPTYTLSGFVFAFQESRSTSYLRPTIDIAFQVLAHDRQPKLQFTDAFRCMTSELCDSLNSIFVDLIQQHDLDEDISQDYLREDELRLCLEDEEMLRCEHEKLIVEENRFRLDEANRLRLEEKNMWQLEEQKKNKRNEFMNSSHGQPGQVKCKFPWNDNYTIDRNFWLKLVFLDPTRKGWLTEEERHEQILELQSLVGSNVAAESVRLLKEF